MSVILDALKKLDREKSSRRNGMPNIAVEILRADLPRPRKRILLYFIAVSIATAATTYVGMAQFGFFLKSSPPIPVNLPPPTKQGSPAPSKSDLSGSSLPAAVTPPAPVQSPEPVRSSRGEAIQMSPKTESDAEHKISSVAPVEKKTSQNLASEEAKIAPPNTIRLPDQAPERSITTPLSLRVSGIIWSEEPSKRIAVINGIPITEGSVIEGVKVVEIHPTRVRFFHNNRSFEIPLGVSYTNKD
jgi:general secretion pathway protein B